MAIASDEIIPGGGGKITVDKGGVKDVTSNSSTNPIRIRNNPIEATEAEIQDAIKDLVGPDSTGNWFQNTGDKVFEIAPDGTVKYDGPTGGGSGGPGGPTALTFNTSTLPNGTFGTSYSQALSASGGTSPYTYTLTGTLPAGLTLSGSTISGIPNTTGTSSFTITLTDSASGTVPKDFSITITSAADTTAPTITALTVDTITENSAVVNITANEAGTYYCLVNTSATATVTDVKTSLNTGSTAAAGSSKAVSISGLTASTPYYAHVVVTDAANNDSTVTSSPFTTSAHVQTPDEILTAAMQTMVNNKLTVTNPGYNYPTISAPTSTTPGVSFTFTAVSAKVDDPNDSADKGIDITSPNGSNTLAYISRMTSGGSTFTATLTVTGSLAGATSQHQVFIVTIPPYTSNNASTNVTVDAN